MSNPRPRPARSPGAPSATLLALDDSGAQIKAMRELLDDFVSVEG